MVCINRNKDCCGCSACVQACHKQCIKLIKDAEGFPYPSIDRKSCAKCGKCDNVCPMMHTNKPQVPLTTYAATNPDEYIRSHSSSGGIFSILAEYVIRQEGVVFGAEFNESWEVVHNYTESIEGLDKFRGSKYVQSRIGASYLDAEGFLKQGRLVLFSGTPCQIAGLKTFLRKAYKNLLTVDCVCHGVPSPDIFREYLNTLHIPNNRINRVDFRNKDLGWKDYCFKAISKTHEGKENTIICETFHQNLFMKSFLSNLNLRPSCYDCHFREGRSGSDITLGDFWGIDKLKPELDDDKGLSLVIVNNKQAGALLRGLGCNLTEMRLSDAIKYNKNITTSVSIPTYRRLFFVARKHFRLQSAVRLCLSRSMPYRIIRKISKLFV